MDEEELRARIARVNVEPPTDAGQMRLLLQLTDFYRESGLLPDGLAPSLARSCPNASSCWSTKRVQERPHGRDKVDTDSEKGCIFLPWVGPAYRPGGVAVLGMNLRYAGGDWPFATEWNIVLSPIHGQLVSLRNGRRAHGSNWAYATMTDVANVLRTQRGEKGIEKPGREERATALLSSARVQAVKCSPIGGRSSPTAEMNANCPPRFLRRELEILRPSTLLAYGQPTHDAIKRLGDVSVLEAKAESGFRRVVLPLASGSVTVFLLTHPASTGWHASRRALIASLEQHPTKPS